MKTNPFWPSRQAQQIIWLLNLLIKLPAYATTLGLTNLQVTSIVSDCLWAVYVMQSWLPETRSWAKACTDALTETHSGTGTANQVLPVFVPPPLPGAAAPVPATVAVAPGAILRILGWAQQIKTSGKCTDAIAQDLGLVGSEQTEPDMNAIQPEIKVMIVAGQVLVKWTWGGHSRYLSSCEIWVDRGDGKGWVFLTIDTTPGYTDTTAFPNAPVKWSYRAIYRAHDVQVGLWSATESLTVAA